MLDPRDTELSSSAQARAQHFESVNSDRAGSVVRARMLVPQHEVIVPASPGGIALGIQHAAKRVVDYLGAGFGLVLISPLLLAVAVLIKLDSPGPALFKQIRIGKGGRPFVFYKFRSMENGCNTASHRDHVTKLIKGALGDADRGSDGSFKLECDPRVTRVGRMIRRASVDELPQLLNVLKGEMSLIGPRPPLPYEVELYTPRDMRRLDVLPGMTGLWQVSGRARLTHEEMVELDIAYVENWSLALDARILLKTFSAVVGEDGAG